MGDRRAEKMYITKLIHKIRPPPKKNLKIESSPPGSDSSYPVK